MGVFYILSLIVLCTGFMSFKKTDEKLNFIKWLILTVVLIYAYNIVIGMTLGLLNITAHIWLLAIINIIFGCLLGFKCITKKEYQKYTVSKLDIAGIVCILIIFGVMFVKDLYIYDGDISHFAMDSAVHYRAAKHYSDNLKIFINVEDKSFFDFNIMQTGAYINDGIFMNVINNITGLDYTYIFQIFETLLLFANGLAFYAFLIDKIKTKRGLLGTIVLFALYIYGYPYNSWIYGFSYLSVGILMTTIILNLVQMLYSKDNLKKWFIITLIVISGYGLIFSYCLFVPAIFAAICVYCFIKDLLNKDTNKVLKIFGKTTLIVTGLLLVVTCVGIGYLFIPSFFIEGQTDLVSALKIDGAIYSEKFANLIPYIPFAIMYIVYLIRKVKNKNIDFLDIFAIFIVGYTALLYIGNVAGLVAPYYLLKVYFILWIAVFAIIAELINYYIDEKLFRIDVIILFLLYVIMLYKGVSSEMIFKTYLVLVLALFVVLPELVKNIDLSKAKKIPEKLREKFSIKAIKIPAYIYVIIWAVFICSWVWLKAGHIVSEDKKHSLPNLVGMYYIENCEYRKLIDLTQNFNANEIELSIYARENLEDMTVENTELITEGYYTRIWATAVLEISSDEIPYQEVVQDVTIYTVDDALNDESKKYIIQLVSEDATKMEEYEETIKEVKENNKITILLENENGFVAEINR